MPLLIPAQRTPEWHEAHRGRITASIAGAVLGLHASISRIKAWKLIQGHATEADNHYMAYGRNFEAQAGRTYVNETGYLIRPTGFWVHPTYNWLGASPDGLIEEEGLIEIKCPNNVPTIINPCHLIQCQVQLAVTGRRWCDYYAWTHRGEHFCQRVERLPEFEETALLMQLFVFWSEFVQTNKQPPRKKPVRRQERKRKADG